MIASVKSITRISSLAEFLVVFVNDYPRRREATKKVIDNIERNFSNDLSDEVKSILPALMNSLDLPVEARFKALTNLSEYLGRPIGSVFPMTDFELMESILEAIDNEYYLILEADDGDAIDIICLNIVEKEV